MGRFLFSLSLLGVVLATGCNSEMRLARNYEAASDEAVEYGEYEEGLAKINKAIELVDDVSEFHEKRGFIHDSTGNYAEAIKSYRKAIELDPDNFWAKNNYVSVLCLSPNEADRNGEEAVNLGQELIEAAAESDEAMMKTYANDTYGSALAEVGRFEEAVKFCERALKTAAPDERALIQTNIASYKQERRTRYQPDGAYEVVPEDSPEEIEELAR